MGYYRNGGDWNRGMAVAVKEVESKGPGMKQLRKDLKALECENNLSMCHQELPDGEEGRWQRGGRYSRSWRNGKVRLGPVPWASVIVPSLPCVNTGRDHQHSTDEDAPAELVPAPLSSPTSQLLTPESICHGCQGLCINDDGNGRTGDGRGPGRRTTREEGRRAKPRLLRGHGKRESVLS